MSSQESMTRVTASTRDWGSPAAFVEKSSWAMARPVLMMIKLVLMAFRSCLASRTLRAKLLMSGMIWSGY